MGRSSSSFRQFGLCFGFTNYLISVAAISSCIVRITAEQGILETTTCKPCTPVQHTIYPEGTDKHASDKECVCHDATAQLGAVYTHPLQRTQQATAMYPAHDKNPSTHFPVTLLPRPHCALSARGPSFPHKRRRKQRFSDPAWLGFEPAVPNVARAKFLSRRARSAVAPTSSKQAGDKRPR